VIAAHHDLSREVVMPAPDSAADNGDGTPCPVRFAIEDRAELKLSASAIGTDRLLKCASPRQVQVTPRSNSNPKV
jgi:hypothetical protein